MGLPIDELQDEVERLLRRCNIETLVEVGTVLGLSDDDMGGTKVSVQRAINQVFDSVDTDGEKISLFSSISSTLPQPSATRLTALLKAPLAPEVASHEDVLRAEEKEKVRKVEEELLAAKLALERAEAAKLALVGGLKRESPRPTVPVRHADFSISGRSPSVVESRGDAEVVAAEVVRSLGLGISGGTSAFKKEFKLSDKVGGAADRRLDWVSLRSQEEEGKARGFSDEEIGWGLKRSVVSGSPLRIYLDSKPDLPLTRVMEMISGSYREKSPSDLFQELNMLS